MTDVSFWITAAFAALGLVMLGVFTWLEWKDMKNRKDDDP